MSVHDPIWLRHEVFQRDGVLQGSVTDTSQAWQFQGDVHRSSICILDTQDHQLAPAHGKGRALVHDRGDFVHRHSGDFHDVLQLVFVAGKLRILPEILNHLLRRDGDRGVILHWLEEGGLAELFCVLPFEADPCSAALFRDDATATPEVNEDESLVICHPTPSWDRGGTRRQQEELGTQMNRWRFIVAVGLGRLLPPRSPRSEGPPGVWILKELLHSQGFDDAHVVSL
mmetsp:Transcript_57473/g.134680  ORF Transcript_57473/g.134680 Transcript_57473/m.134680 type:complete len:228 (-) Transcript_57473:335-1018(-)